MSTSDSVCNASLTKVIFEDKFYNDGHVHRSRQRKAGSATPIRKDRRAEIIS